MEGKSNEKTELCLTLCYFHHFIDLIYLQKMIN